MSEQTGYTMAAEIRALRENNAELGASLGAALKRIDEAAAIERRRIVSMLTRWAAMDEDDGDLGAADVQRGIVREIEALRHLGQDGRPLDLHRGGVMSPRPECAACGGEPGDVPPCGCGPLTHTECGRRYCGLCDGSGQHWERHDHTGLPEACVCPQCGGHGLHDEPSGARVSPLRGGDSAFPF